MLIKAPGTPCPVQSTAANNNCLILFDSTKSTTSNGGGDITIKDNVTTLTRNGNVNNKSNASTLGRQKQSVNDKSTSKQSTVEWNCPHCTFINTDAKRICEMCSKSQDFYAEPDKPVKATATCV